MKKNKRINCEPNKVEALLMIINGQVETSARSVVKDQCVHFWKMMVAAKAALKRPEGVPLNFNASTLSGGETVYGYMAIYLKQVATVVFDERTKLPGAPEVAVEAM